MHTPREHAGPGQTTGRITSVHVWTRTGPLLRPFPRLTLNAEGFTVTVGRNTRVQTCSRGVLAVSVADTRTGSARLAITHRRAGRHLPVGPGMTEEGWPWRSTVTLWVSGRPWPAPRTSRMTPSGGRSQKMSRQPERGTVNLCLKQDKGS